MRYLRLAFLLLGFLAFLATAAPVASPELDLQNVEANEQKRSSNVILFDRGLSHPAVQAASYAVRSVCAFDDKDCVEESSTDSLEKRGRVRKARPSRKRPTAKQTRRKKKHSTKKPSTKKPTTKKPTTGATGTGRPNTGIRPGTGTGGSKGGKPTTIKAKPTKSKDYIVVEAAAKKKGKKLVVGKSYLLTEMSPAVISHHKLIVAKIVRKKVGRKYQLDVKATMQQLILREGERGTCFEFFGGTCKNAPLKEYSCAQRVESGRGAFKFEGTAKPEFADPEHFIVQGMCGRMTERLGGMAC